MKKSGKSSLAIFFIFFSLSSVTAQKHSHLLYDLDFNHGVSGNNLPFREVFDNKAQTITDSVMRYGKKSVRMEVNFIFNNNKSCRSDFVFKAEINANRWYGFSVFAPKYFLPDPEAESITQWHNVPDFKLGEGWVSPSLNLIAKNGRWVLCTLWDTAKVTIQNHWMGAISSDLGPICLNSWTDFVFHVKFSYKSDGLVEVFKNGTMIYHRKGPNNFNDASLPNWKVGLYKSAYLDNNTHRHKYLKRVLFYSQIREGDEMASYKDVAAR